jgi:SAM-dependent methyltransferase
VNKGFVGSAAYAHFPNMSFFQRQSALWLRLRRKLSFCKRQVIWSLLYLKAGKKSVARFRCNVCGERTMFPRDKMSREAWSCRYCSSSVRVRSVVHALSMELFGKSLAIVDFPERPDLVGVGLSDWYGLAAGLARKLGYANTYYHKEPFLDIATKQGLQHDLYDFIISSDVFEHVCPPISTAFVNAYNLLKPGGVMILTVPYTDGATREHFPSISTCTVQKEDSVWTLTGMTSEGRTEKFANLVFHGGPGTTVEFRLFGKDSMMRDCQSAGFDSVRIHEETVEEFGIYWNPYNAEDAPYRPLIYGLDTPPWALRKSKSAKEAEQ